MAYLIENDCVKLENDFLQIEIQTEKSKIGTFFVLNKQSGEKIAPLQTSELFELNFKGGLFAQKLCASSLKIKRTFGLQSGLCEKLVLEFEEVTVKKVPLCLSLTYELGQREYWFRKYLTISSSNPGEKVVLDYIDFFPLRASAETKTDCLPPQKKSHVSGAALSIGQPVFYASAFLGCEFPATVNTVEEGTVKVRYYSGKKLSALLENGEYISHKAVCGMCPSSDGVIARKALYDYIEKISKPLVLRTQYNSWYDHMLNISAENIEQSFLEIEKAMTAVGSKPLDCFVVDDGWNDYKKDFWCFNSKFPNELYPSSNLTQAFGSSFGLWLGPRGGYTVDTVKFAKQIENGANGYFNRRSLDIDVASEKYINKVSDLMVDYEKRFKLKYWKLDGFMQKPCRNANHDHMTGGFNDMYYYSQGWERWIEIFKRLEKESDGGVFINLTCYAPPSPWMLQFVNCMWMQVSDDMGVITKDENGKKLGCSKKDAMLTYRDDRYYDFLKVRKFAFPQSRIYNHDPIYANEAKVTMTDEEFRSYLFSMAGRGNAFWELYYSFNLMNEEKWRINNDVLLFIEENLRLLKNSTMFGARPSSMQVYGFGSFGKNEGIVMLRNPSGQPKNYTLCLDDKIGAQKELSGARLITVLPYNENGACGKYGYADTVNVMLAPYETKILHFGAQPKMMKVQYVKARSKNELEVMFNQPVVCGKISCVQNKILSCTLLADRRSVLLKFEKPFEQTQSYTLTGVEDLYLFDSDCDVDFDYYENNLVTSGRVRGSGEFSIVATTGGEHPELLFRQGEEIELGIRNDKYYFRVANTTVCSKTSAGDVVQVCAVRERNGVLKLYLNKHLDSGARADGVVRLSGEEAEFFDQNKVKLYSKAFAYNEV